MSKALYVTTPEFYGEGYGPFLFQPLLESLGWEIVILWENYTKADIEFHVRDPNTQFLSVHCHGTEYSAYTLGDALHADDLKNWTSDRERIVFSRIGTSNAMRRTDLTGINWVSQISHGNLEGVVISGADYDYSYSDYGSVNNNFEYLWLKYINEGDTIIDAWTKALDEFRINYPDLSDPVDVGLQIHGDRSIRIQDIEEVNDMAGVRNGIGTTLVEPCEPNRRWEFFGQQSPGWEIPQLNCPPTVEGASRYDVSGLQPGDIVPLAVSTMWDLSEGDYRFIFKWLKPDGTEIREGTYGWVPVPEGGWIYAYDFITLSDIGISENGTHRLEIRIEADFGEGIVFYGGGYFNFIVEGIGAPTGMILTALDIYDGENWLSVNVADPSQTYPMPANSNEVWVGMSIVGAVAGDEYRLRVSTPRGDFEAVDIAASDSLSSQVNTPTGSGTETWTVTMSGQDGSSLSFPVIVETGAAPTPVGLLSLSYYNGSGWENFSLTELNPVSANLTNVHVAVGLLGATVGKNYILEVITPRGTFQGNTVADDDTPTIQIQTPTGNPAIEGWTINIYEDNVQVLTYDVQMEIIGVTEPTPTFTLGRPTVPQESVPAGTTVLISCPTNVANVLTSAYVNVRCIVFEGSALPGAGTQLWEQTTAVSFPTDGDYTVNFSRITELGTIDRRDVQVEVYYEEVLVASGQWDDVFFVTEEEPPPVEPPVFTLSVPTADPVSSLPGSVSLTFPINLTNAPEGVAANVRCIVYEGSALPGAGTQLWEQTQAIVFGHEGDWEVDFYHPSEIGTIDRRDVGLEIILNGEVIASGQWDDVFYVLSEPPPEPLEFTINPPVANPTQVEPDSTVEITVPITVINVLEAISINVRCIVYEGSPLPGAGTELWQQTQVMLIDTNGVSEAIFLVPTVLGTIDRRDVGIEVYYANELVASGQWDDVYFVEVAPPPEITVIGIDINGAALSDGINAIVDGLLTVAFSGAVSGERYKLRAVFPESTSTTTEVAIGPDLVIDLSVLAPIEEENWNISIIYIGEVETVMWENTYSVVAAVEPPAFTLSQPSADPTVGEPGLVTINVPINLTNSGGLLQANVRCIVYEGSELPGAGTKLWEQTQVVNFDGDGAYEVLYIHESELGTIDRRDVGVEVRYQGTLAAADEWDDVFYVAEEVVPPPEIIFTVSRPTAEPQVALPGPVTITCPINVLNAPGPMSMQVRCLVFEGSGLPGAGTLLWQQTQVINIEGDGDWEVQFVRNSVTGTIDRRDVGIELILAGTVVASEQYDDVFFVEQMPSITYKVTVTAPSGGIGATEPDTGVYEVAEGEVFEILAIVGTDYVFELWESKGMAFATSNPLILNVVEDLTINAVFSPIAVPPGEVSLTISVIGTVEGGGTTLPMPGSHTYIKDEEVEITAIPDEGMAFSHWVGNVSGQANPITIIMNKNKSITAVFVPEGEAPGEIPWTALAIGGGLLGVILLTKKK